MERPGRPTAAEGVEERAHRRSVGEPDGQGWVQAHLEGVAVAPQHRDPGSEREPLGRRHP
ncbi:hypothetical protein [Nocardioides stalactiti]|uniref:hypothetical protein n=1 Tax=Nocardioides stalactiti TaxID=2755356 RepID=UPI0016022145|nr:hypothetical protein [Nocardioides stalactiti]